MFSNFKDLVIDYQRRSDNIFTDEIITQIEELSNLMQSSWTNKSNIFLCGNGGSAGNAIHLANDFIYGVGTKKGIGMRIEALSSNPAVITCLGNDIGYENIFSEQIRVKADKHDLLIVFSGSGNSQNIINAVNEAKKMSLHTVAVLGYDGGGVKSLVDLPIHFPVNDMQVSEDLQLIVGHICMQWLNEKEI